MKAMVLAAGRGERLRPITDTLPKPLVRVAGRPLIVYHLQALARAGIRDVVINLSWLGGRIRAELGDGSAHGVHIQYSDEGPVALDTGGGIHHALDRLGPEPFLLVNGDTWTDLDFGSLCAHAQSDTHAGVLARLVLVPNPSQHPQGDFALQGDRVVDLPAPAPRFTYSGIAMLRPELFAGSAPGKFSLVPLLKRASAAGRLRGQLYGGGWCDVGTVQRLAELERRLIAERLPMTPQQ